MVVMRVRAPITEPFLLCFWLFCALISSSLRPSKEGIVTLVFQKTESQRSSI